MSIGFLALWVGGVWGSGEGNNESGTSERMYPLHRNSMMHFEHIASKSEDFRRTSSPERLLYTTQMYDRPAVVSLGRDFMGQIKNEIEESTPIDENS